LIERKIVPKKKEEDKMVIDEKKFFSLILGAKLVGHILHLQCKEFAAHIALDEFYKGTQKAADKIIEVYQGAVESIIEYDHVMLTIGMHEIPLSYLTQLREGICDNRYLIVSEELSNVHNEIDNFISIIDTAIYKITYLK
jgi:hypothetical protein